jgi:hypothetical protein
MTYHHQASCLSPHHVEACHTLIVVPAFEEVSVVEQASGEEQSSVGSGPDAGVVEHKPVVSSEQGKPQYI